MIHCSATRENTDYSPEQLESDHKARGFLRAGYNFYIRKSGEVVNLRPLEQIPAHARGHNKHSIGICYEGGLDCRGRPADTRPPEQRAALRLLVHQLLEKFPACRVCGHRDLSEDLNGDGTISPDEWIKQCPSFNAISEYKELVYELRKK